MLLNTPLPPAEVVHIAGTVDRTPEVMIKVVSPGSNTLQAIRQHFEDLQNGKNRALEMDFFITPVVGKRAARRLVEDWDFDLDALYWRQPYLVPARRTPPKLAHKLIFSMPAGTLPDKLLAAVRNFARDEFKLHRYALALHTDEPHPHVHVVVKAMSEEGVHFNIRKLTLREWRQAFARHLRAQGIRATATQRPGRRQPSSHKLKGMRRPVSGRQAVFP